MYFHYPTISMYVYIEFWREKKRCEEKSPGNTSGKETKVFRNSSNTWWDEFLVGHAGLGTVRDPIEGNIRARSGLVHRRIKDRGWNCGETPSSKLQKVDKFTVRRIQYGIPKQRFQSY